MSTHKESKVLSVLKRNLDSICTNSYTDVVNEEERHCLLGWLAVEAGIALPEVDFNSYVLGMDGTLEFADSLEAEYGLPLETLKLLQFVNDDATSMQELIEKVHRILANAREAETQAA